ncbi:MAG: acyl-CoA dehydrogenase family protein [Acidimicrobiaceae bacterium]|nr:acyl-CoA dehydrogenase family protein [Acidimicrobiaceae bacterium]
MTVAAAPGLDLERFRASAEAWLAANAPAKGSPDDFTSGREREFVDGCRRWQGRLHAAGWAGITWPAAHGGLGLPPVYDLAFRRLQSRFGASTAALEVGLGMVAPTIMKHGTEEQQAAHLPALLRGDEVWCQMFSEPGAGSDLAGLTTAARRRGRGWVIDGQKVWTSYARFADYAALLARSDPDRPKHRGITFFLLDMRSPGIEVRPIRQMNGAAEFNQVFLNGVEVPDEAVLGEVHGGWTVASTLLGNERGLTGDDWLDADDLVSLARAKGVSGDAKVRQGIAEVFVGRELLRYLDLRVQERMAAGQPIGPLASIVNLALARHLRRSSEVASQLLGPALVAGADDAATGWAFQVLTAPCVRIASGTDEIQRNILGERTLGLPREPRPVAP